MGALLQDLRYGFRMLGCDLSRRQNRVCEDHQIRIVSATQPYPN
jgi:hypothetical protein